MRVRLATRARQDVNEIIEYIERDNPARALSFGEEILDSCARLSWLGPSFALVPGMEHLGVRRHSHGRYLIFYIVHDEIEVVRVLHSARDYLRLLFSREP